MILLVNDKLNITAKIQRKK